MKLLITTQAVDRNDPVLGFFHGWIAEFAKHFDHVHVICLKEGEHVLPGNVTVYSLGKELGENRFKYIWRFYRYVWILRKQCDVIFSHMNPHYIVLAGIFWSLYDKRMFLWRNHAKMNVKTQIAAWFSESVFYTSPFACTQRFKHSIQMPVGINTALFNTNEESVREPKSVLFLGRLSPVKRPELFMRSVALLDDCVVNVYGEVMSGSRITKESLMELAQQKVKFHGSIKNEDTPGIYRTHEVYVNLTPEGSMDKTVLEAAACGALVLVTNRSFESVLPKDCLVEDNPQEIANGIEKLTRLSAEKKSEYRRYLRDMVENKHSLALLVKTFVSIVHSKQ